MRYLFRKLCNYVTRSTKFYYRSFYKPRTVTLDGYKVIIDYEIFSPRMLEAFFDETYEDTERGALTKILEPDDRVMEIGSGIGILAMKTAAMVGEKNVLCYEANPRIVALSRANHELNGFHIQVENRVLVGNPTEPRGNQTARFYVHEDFWASSLIRQDGTREEIEVPVESFQARLAEYKPTTLIIDIEGGEVELLNNSNLTSVQKIILEAHYESAGRQSINRMIKQLYDKGFFIDLSHSYYEFVVLRRE